MSTRTKVSGLLNTIKQINSKAKILGLEKLNFNNPNAPPSIVYNNNILNNFKHLIDYIRQPIYKQ